MSAGTVTCELCFRGCMIEPGSRGNCRARYNLDGQLVSLVYGKPCAVHIDPIEKKPMFHFLPGTRSFSIATAGCNGHCLFCQNWEISQRNPEETDNVDLPPRAVVAQAAAAGCPSISYTYSDPSIFYEYAYDAAALARKRGIRNVLVTAGFLNEKPLRALAKVVDAANLDVKGNAAYYKKIVQAELAPVQDYARIAHEEGIFLELTNLIVPTLNDAKADIEWLVKWILDTLGPDTPLHFSRFFPMYKLTNLYPTPAETLFDAAHLATDLGMHYVYVGNLPSGDWESTKCPKCKDVVIERHGYLQPVVKLVNGKCPTCGERIPGVWR
jgi:pyruvate formate lyase activating enzyme